MKSTSYERMNEIHKTLCKEYGTSLQLRFKKMRTTFLNGWFCSALNEIVVNDKVVDKGGTLLHEWTHYINLNVYHGHGHTRRFAEIQKYLMLRFKIKFREEAWSEVKIWQG